MSPQTPGFRLHNNRTVTIYGLHPARPDPQARDVAPLNAAGLWQTAQS